MSNRTVKARKAVLAAMEKERQLVLEGKGTRDWTPEQQRSIIDKGKAYDENGRAFEGHHMKSVSLYPEYQGDADNIQFLSRSEHLEAHGGNFQNATNGYYDYITGETRDFGIEKYKPCNIIALSTPVVSPVEKKRENTNDGIREHRYDGDKSRESNESETSGNRKDTNVLAAVEQNVRSYPRFQWSRIFNSVISLPKKHPKIVGAIKTIGIGAVAYLATDYISKKESRTRDTSRESDILTESGDNWSDFDKPDVADEREYPEERSSPHEHDVSGYDRLQNGKKVHVRPHKRGVKQDE